MALDLKHMCGHLRNDTLILAECDELAEWIVKAYEALRWYASAEYSSRTCSDAQLQSRADEALKGVE